MSTVKAQRPNILWYCTDQQRFDTVGGLGNPHIHTPCLDAWMQQAMAFTHAVCQAPICTPSRASFLTGMYPSAIGVNGNGIECFPREHESRLVTHALARQGYDCGLVGKLHLSGAARGREPRVADGYDVVRYSHSSKMPEGHDYADWLRDQGHDPAQLMIPQRAQAYRQGAAKKSSAGVYVPTPDQDNIPPHLHQTHWCTEQAIEFFKRERRPDQPWLLSVNPFDPHPPFDAPWEYFRRYDPAQLPGAHYDDGDLAHQLRLRDAGIDFQADPKPPPERDHKLVQASYFAMIEQIDHEFGRLLDYLKSSGQFDDTIVIFTSDHGEALCDHGLVAKGCRFFEGMVLSR